MLKRWSLAGLMLVAVGCGSQVDGTDVDNNGGPGGDGGATGGALNGGGTAGPTNGTGGTGGNSGNSTGIDNDGKCEEFVAQAKPTTPDMLIVLDRSGSMKRGTTNRWDPSVSALKAVTSMLDDKIRFGMMVFPTPKPCGMNDGVLCALDGCRIGTLEVPIALAAGDEVARVLDATAPSGGTPTGATLQEALTVLKPDIAGPDAVVTPKYVLLVTDGQPTCPSGGGGANATPQQLADDKKLTLDAIDALLTAGAKTYVIGYIDSNDDPSLPGSLTEFAMHGGTKDYRPVQDEQSLLTEFEKITGEVVSCSYELDMVPPDPKTVLVKLDGKQLNLNDKDNGWTIKGKTVTVEGKSCALLQDGKDHVLTVDVLCQVVPII